MVDIYAGPFGGYVPMTGPITAPIQLEIIAEVNKLLALFPDPALAGSTPHPDFDLIPPEMVTKLRTEIIALRTAIDATPAA